MSLCVVPIVPVLLLGSIYVNVTGTPVAFVGFGDCSKRYAIHELMLASDMAGVPASGMPKQVCPGD